MEYNYIYIDVNDKEHVFENKEMFLKYIKENDYEFYELLMYEEATKDDYNGHDIGTATALEIERQNNDYLK